MNAVILKGRHEWQFFFEKQPPPFFKSRTCTTIGSFESPMSQVSQKFLFVFIAPLEKFSQPLEVESFRHFEEEMTEYST